MGYKLEFTISATHELVKLPKAIQKRIISKLNYYLTADQPLQFAKPLIHSMLGDYRFRIGDYRVIVRVQAKTIFVMTLGHRRDIYHS